MEYEITPEIEKALLAKLHGVEGGPARDKRYCEKCNYIGFTMNAKQEAMQCECAKRAMIEGLYETWNLPRTFRRESLESLTANDENIDAEKVKRVCAWRDRFCGVLQKLIHNDLRLEYKVGGKDRTFNSILIHLDDVDFASQLAVDIAKSAPRQHGIVKYYSYSDLFATLSDYKSSEEQDEIAEQWETAGLIVVDGVDHRPANASFINQWSLLCHRRINNGLPIIIVAFSDPAKAVNDTNWHRLINGCYPFTGSVRQGFEDKTVSIPKATVNKPSTDPLNDDEITEAILGYLQNVKATNADAKFKPSLKTIQTNVRAESADVTRNIRNLQAEGEIAEVKIEGKDTLKGYHIVYADETSPPKKVTANQMSLADLSKRTGKGRTTIHRWRGDGLSDSQILDKCGCK